MPELLTRLRRTLRRDLYRSARLLALGMMAVAAMFGIPLIIDPPPRDKIAESQDADGRPSRPRRRRRGS